MSFSGRLRELVLSVYLYNEWRGYVQLETDLIPELEKRPDFDREFVDGVKKHAADERKHYKMFKGWFSEKGVMPFAVSSAVGYFDTLSHLFLGKRSDETSVALVGNPERFASLCRAVITTEKRGIQQLDMMLKWRSVAEDPRLKRVLEVIRADEPSHFGPYEKWLARHGYAGPSWREKAADCLVHYTIALLIIPALFLDLRLKRLVAYQA